jgi:hypothetical protein
LANLQQDLQTKRLLMLAETEKLVDCERRLYESEQQLSAVRAQNVRLQLRVDELRLKLEPGEQSTSLSQYSGFFFLCSVSLHFAELNVNVARVQIKSYAELLNFMVH